MAGAALFSGCARPAAAPSAAEPGLLFPGEKHFRNLRQLTHGGTNAEAYWSFDSQWLSFQHKGPGLPPSAGPDAECDQIYAIRADGSEVHRVSNGKGRTTCSYFFPGDQRVLFSSTSGADEKCPAQPDMSKGYVWPIYDTYQFYSAKPDGTGTLPLEPGAPRAYNAEATACSDGSVIFTSDRDGDLELYRGKLDPLGTMGEIKRLTNTPGYDGGAFFSADCKRIVWRASRPKPGRELDDYRALLKRHLVRPGQLEIWVADADGSHAHQVTRMGAASFAPFFTPDGKSILFASNPRDPHGRKFDIYKINVNGTGLERVTYSDTFESFPMFSPDGKKVAFSSNRNAKLPHETNVFVADWVDEPAEAVAGRTRESDDADPAGRFQDTVSRLSAPEMEGRGVGTRGLGLAEALVAEKFRAAGLSPFPGPDYLQGVEIQTGVSVRPEGTRLEVPDAGALKTPEDFVPAGFSASTAFSGAPVDAGYGIVAPELGLNDYANADVKGRVALIRRHVPGPLHLTPEQERAYGDLRYKAFLAREKGAAAVFFWEAAEDIPENFAGELARYREQGPTGEAGIPVLFLARRIARGLAKGGPGTVKGAIALDHTAETAHNVLGTLGGGCGKVRPVVIGAHLDHLGHGGAGSFEPSRGGIHPGADDNASGVAALLEVARLIGARQATAEGAKAARGECFLFAAFTGEEVGVVGSSHLARFLEASPAALHPKAMLNMDMVGRMENNRLLVFGSDSATEWNALVQAECGSRMLACGGGGDGYGPSDHMPFYMNRVPVLHFFTGPHADYHRTTDLPDRINATGGIQSAEVVAAVALRAASPRQPLHYQKPVAAPSMGRLGRAGDSRSHGAYLGTIPDYSTMASPHGPGADPSAGGVKLAGARAGSPAEQAGVKAGDILISITDAEATHSIHSLEDFMYVLTSLKPGQKITLGVKRSENLMSLPATVGHREAAN